MSSRQFSEHQTEHDLDITYDAPDEVIPIMVQQDSVKSSKKVGTTIPEVNGLTWDDKFFDTYEDDTIIAVFDFDYISVESKYGAYANCAHALGSLGMLVYCVLLVLVVNNFNHVIGYYPIYLWFVYVVGVGFIAYSDVEWKVRSRHIAITEHGVLFVHDKRKYCFGCRECDIGKVTTTVCHQHYLFSIRLTSFWIRNHLHLHPFIY